MTRQRGCNTAFALLNKPNSSHQILNAALRTSAIRCWLAATWILWIRNERNTQRGYSSRAIDFSSTGFHYSGYLRVACLFPPRPPPIGIRVYLPSFWITKARENYVQLARRRVYVAAVFDRVLSESFKAAPARERSRNFIGLLFFFYSFPNSFLTK